MSDCIRFEIDAKFVTRVSVYTYVVRAHDCVDDSFSLKH